MRSIRIFSVAASALLGMALISGCSSSGRVSEGEKAIEGFAKLKQGLVNGQKQVDTTLAAMDKLAAGGDMKASSKAFGNEIADLEKAAENARKRSNAMRENTEKYIARWQEEMKDIQDPTIKAGLAERREAVRNNFNQVRSAVEATRDAYQPFLRDLQEIQKAVSVDMSPAALPGLKPGMAKAHTDGATLKTKIGALITELDKIQAGMGAAAKK